MEYIMSFLMGLDDSFSQVRGQLLLMDLMSLINRVFSLIVQEEQQRMTNPSSDSSNSTGTMAFAVKTDVAKSGGSDLPIDCHDSNSPIVSSSGPSPSSVASTSAANIPVDDIPTIAPSPSGGVVLRKSTRLFH
ncbi:hypothetical protein F0562_007112 [Nyssa sinensis]|uniref:Uncharacterized protein n=1 Tax=Nyssa sinensis TaxID=561372 RepID=A0A5J5A7C5_9ASTE|nr:hypothetical protein F0562_007112 [Nyssa sinensis]